MRLQINSKLPVHWSRRSGKSLAVLYFTNLSRSQQDEYFRDGVAEDIMLELSRIKELSIRPRSSVIPFRDQPVNAAEVGRQLNTAYVLDGSFSRFKKSLRLAVQLLETKTQRVVWTERYDREVDDVFAIQDEIARSVAEQLRLVLSKEETKAIAKVPTTSVEAYEHSLRGRQHFRQFRRKSIDHARREFARAIEFDPNYAGAYAGLADSYSYLYMFWDSSPEYLSKADEASAQAVHLDEDLAEAHVARGVALSIAKRHREADGEFRTAIRLDPNLFEACYFYARGHYAQGKLDRAVHWFEKACEVRPEDYQAPTLLGSALRGMGLRTRANEAFRRSAQLAQKHLEVYPGETRALYFAAISLCQLGENLEQAREWADRALAIDPEEPQVLYNVACAYALLGKTEEALDCLARTVAHGEWWRQWMSNDPDLEVLHGSQRFQELTGAS